MLQHPPKCFPSLNFGASLLSIWAHHSLSSSIHAILKSYLSCIACDVLFLLWFDNFKTRAISCLDFAVFLVFRLEIAQTWKAGQPWGYVVATTTPYKILACIQFESLPWVFAWCLQALGLTPWDHVESLHPPCWTVQRTSFCVLVTMPCL